MDDQQQELYSRIAHFAFDEGDETLTFAARLARENAWSSAFAARAIAEYRRFVWLALTAGHEVTPSDAVDQVWHLHLTYTRSYWDRFCADTLRQPLHHGPTKGGERESRRYAEQYERTLASYREFFAEEAPEDVWPAATIRFGKDTRQQRVNTARYWIIRKPRWELPAVTALAVLPLVGFAPLWANASRAIFAVVLIVVLLLVVSRIIAWFYRIGGGSNGGSGCGGCGGDGGCGGGCGGGGCGGCGG